MVTVPDRKELLGLTATESDTVPFPLPLEPGCTVIQGALLDADHEHPDPAVTPTERLPPDAARD